MSTKGITDTRQVKHRFGKQSAKIACVAYNAAKALERILIRKRFIARELLSHTKNAPRATSRGVGTLATSAKQNM